jgi:hypothetical protein
LTAYLDTKYSRITIGITARAMANSEGGFLIFMEKERRF